MGMFKVAIGKHGKEALWRDYWLRARQGELPTRLRLGWVALNLSKQQARTMRSKPFNGRIQIAP